MQREYTEWLLAGRDGQKQIYIDETVYKLWITRTRGRVPQVIDVSIVGGRTGPNVTVIIAVSITRGSIFSSTDEGGMNSDAFKTFLISVSIAAGLLPATILFDNVPCHSRSPNIIKFVES